MPHADPIEKLSRARYLCLATFRRSGVAVETPVWFAPHQGRLYVFSEATAGKVKRLRNDPRARVAPCNVSGRRRGEWIEARASRVESVDVEATAYRALRAKYGWQMRTVDAFSRLAGRIDGRAILAIELQELAP